MPERCDSAGGIHARIADQRERTEVDHGEFHLRRVERCIKGAPPIEVVAIERLPEEL